MQAIVHHNLLGPVTINFRRDSRSVRACWKKGRVVVTAAVGIDRQKLLRIIDEMASDLMKIKPSVASMFQFGRTMTFDDWQVEFISQNRFPDEILVSYKNNIGTIAFWEGLDQGQMERLGSKGLKHIASKIAPKILPPYFQKCAENISKFPTKLSIVNTTRRLGSCNKSGHITLSSHLMFLPNELRELIFYHELAHLTHMNHSSEFHALLDSYLGGNEQMLSRKLKAFKWPLLR